MHSAKFLVVARLGLANGHRLTGSAVRFGSAGSAFRFGSAVRPVRFGFPKISRFGLVRFGSAEPPTLFGKEEILAPIESDEEVIVRRTLLSGDSFGLLPHGT